MRRRGHEGPTVIAAHNSFRGLRATGCARVYPPAGVEVERECAKTEPNQILPPGFTAWTNGDLDAPPVDASATP